MRLITIVASMPKGADMVDVSRLEHSIQIKAESTPDDQPSRLELWFRASPLHATFLGCVIQCVVSHWGVHAAHVEEVALLFAYVV